MILFSVIVTQSIKNVTNIFHLLKDFEQPQEGVRPEMN